MRLVPRVIAHAPPGTVLAIPESAVVDFGNERIVYLERMPGMFDGVRVELGPRGGGYYPVLGGIAAGDHVVVAGAFLLDAEARLNPALASSYFGAGPNAGAVSKTTASGKAASVDQTDKIAKALAVLGPEDRLAAERQRTCPVTGLPLGSMGTPIKVAKNGRDVFVCCQACIAQLNKEDNESPPEK